MSNGHRGVVLLCLSLLIASPYRLFAQWQTSATMPYAITCVKFLQEEGLRLATPQPSLHHGVIGEPQHIGYCFSGSNWLSATVPSNWGEGYVTDFTFEDTLVGYAAVYGASSAFYTNPTVSGILKTTDGGASWSFLLSAPFEVRGVYFNKQNGRLFASSGGIDGGGGMGSGLWVSTNHGAGWSHATVTSQAPLGSTPYSSRCNFTGFASWDGMHIALATTGNSCSGETDPPNIPSWLYSNDGGSTWQASTMSASSMQPVAIKGTNQFYASSDQNGTSAIYRSNDYGKSFRPVYGFTASSSDLNEVMGGDACLLVAGDSVNSGTYYSIDEGQTWATVSNSPASPLDLRYYVGADSLWAFHGNALQVAARPTPNAFHISPSRALDFPNSGCFTSDSMIRITGCTSCGSNSQFISANIIVISGSNNFSISTAPLPHQLCGFDTLHVLYTPNSLSPDTSLLLLTLRDDSGQMYVDTITLSGAGNPSGIRTFPSQSNLVFSLNTCQTLDTGIWLFNSTCTDFEVIRMDISGDPQFHVDTLLLPDTIKSKGGSKFIRITFLSPTPNSPAGFTKTITITTKSSSTTQTYKFYLSAFVTGGGMRPGFRWSNVHVKYPCTAPGKFDTAIYVFDTSCEAITIDNIQIGNGTCFHLSSTPTLPLTLMPFDPNTGMGKFSERFGVHFELVGAGKCNDSIVFTGHFADGTAWRTAERISLIVDSPINLTPTHLSPIHQSFGVVQSCKNAHVSFYEMNNNACSYTDTARILNSKYTTGFATYNYHLIHWPAEVWPAGFGDSILVAWPFGADGGQLQTGWIDVSYRHGSDSNVVRYSFDGVAVPCNVASVDETSQTFTKVMAVDNKIVIQLTSSIAAKFELTNLLGQTMLATEINGTTSIDARSLPAGVYFYRVSAGSRITSGKIVLP